MEQMFAAALVAVSVLFSAVRSSAAEDFAGCSAGGDPIREDVKVFTLSDMSKRRARPVLASVSQVNAPARGVLVWMPKVQDQEYQKTDFPNLCDLLVLAYGTKIPSDARYASTYANGIAVSSIVGNTTTAVDLPDSLDSYALVFVMFPYTPITGAQVTKLKSVLARGGRVVLMGDHGNYAATEDGHLNQLAADLGANIAIVKRDLSSSGAPTFNVGACDLLKNPLAEYPSPNRYAQITVADPAQVVSTSASGYVWCADQKCGNGRVTVFSDMNWFAWTKPSDSALIASAVPLLERLYSDAVSGEQKEIDDWLTRLTALDVVSGPSSLEGGESGTYVARATFADGSQSNVTAACAWSLSNGTYGTFVAPGELKTEVASDSDRTTAISIAYSHRDITLSATYAITIRKQVCPASLVAGSGATRPEWTLVAGEEGEATYVVSNPGVSALTGLKAEVIGCPSSCLVSCTPPSTIAAKSQATVLIRVKALAASPSTSWETFTIRLTSSEGVSLDIPAAFHAASERAVLSTVEEQLVSTMAIGERTEISFTLVNDSAGASGRIRLDFTTYDWLGLVGAKTLPSLGPGESRTVTLALEPPEAKEWSAVAYTGSVVYTCENGTGGSIGFAFTPVTDKTGALQVTCKDNSGTDGAYKPYAGATVTLLNSRTFAELRSGTSDAQGLCLFEEVPVGRYVLRVTAPDHDAEMSVVYVHAGATAEARALLNVSMVTGYAEFRQITIDDEYVLVYRPQLVFVVPAPNIDWTLEPDVLAEGGTTVVKMHVRNDGLVRASSITFAFPDYPAATHHIAFSDNGFPLEPKEEHDVTVRFVCDDCECRGTGLNRVAYVLMNVAYECTDPEKDVTKTVGYCDGLPVFHGHVPEPVYEEPEFVFTLPKSVGRRDYDPDYELLNKTRVVYKTGNYKTRDWPTIARHDAVVPVTLEIQQPVALARDVIEGSFVFSNKSETAVAYIHLDLKVQNEAGEDCLGLFELVPTNNATGGEVPLDGLRLVTNEVTLAALRQGRAGFWFVPKRDAAPTVPVDYYFGGSFVYRIGPDGAPQTNDLQFCKMTVSPMPYLKMDYFTQRDVFSDNPFTDVAEAYQPAEFALRVRNIGGGTAKNVRIGSSRPKIVDNQSNLQVDFDLRNWSYESYLDGSLKTLDLDTVSLGDIAAGATTVAEWLFVSTLEGHFTTNGQARLEYTKPWQNSETTQISEDVGVHLLVHRCDGGDGDGIVDFLTSEKSTGGPDRLWLSNAEAPVPVNTNATASLVGDTALGGTSDTLTLTVTSLAAGPVYVSVEVEDAKTYRVSALSRDGGVALPPDNAWTTDRTYVPTDLATAFGSRPIREGRLHLFDVFDTAGTRTYTVTLVPRFVYVVGAEEAGYRVGDTYETSVPTTTVPRSAQYYCSGWTALCDGTPVASGNDNEVSFTLEEAGRYETSLEWSTNYWISAANTDNGRVSFAPAERKLLGVRSRFAAAEQKPEEDWYAAGSNVRLKAVPNEGYCLDHWTGDTADCSSEPGSDTITVPVNRARTISAVFKPLSQTVRLGDAVYSETIPAAGDLAVEYWSDVTVDVVQDQVNCGATQYVCRGWTATNADPPSGTDGHAVFTVRGDVTLEWLWQTNVVALADSVNASNLVWTTGGARDWTPEWNTGASDGKHQAVVGAIANNTNAWIETTVSGAGTLSFVWKSALAGKNTKLRFYVDGESNGALAGTNDWTEAEVTLLGKGTHTFQWRLFTGRSGASDGDCGVLDKVVWTPATPPTFGQALNADLEWTTDGNGDVSWEGLARESLAETREAWAEVSGLGDNEYAELTTRVYGTGVLTFDWAVSCEEDYDSFEVWVDGVFRSDISGETEWSEKSLEIKGDGWHTVCWTYVKDEEDDPELVGDNTARLDNVVWNSGAGLPPDIADDDGASVTGNATDGFVLTPSAGRTSVVVEIPSATDPAKVTVVVPHDLASIVPNGASLRIMKGDYDLTDYLELPTANVSGAIALAEAKVKESVVKEAIDPAKGAVITLDSACPFIRTSATKPGLVYTFAESTSLDGLGTPQQTYQGDGAAWTPVISDDAALKSSPSRFFCIRVDK